MAEVDYVEVSREAHQLEISHGRNAWKHANRLAELAKKEDKTEESELWNAVTAALKPR